MKQDYKNHLVNNLIIKNNYSILKYQDGSFAHSDVMTLLGRNYSGTDFIVSLIDADVLSVDDIRKSMESDWEAINASKNSYSTVFVKIFLFNETAPMNKLNAINETQNRQFMNRKYLVAYSIELNNKIKVKHFKLPVYLNGLDKTIVTTLNSDLSAPIEVITVNPEVEQMDNSIPNIDASKPLLTYFIIGLNAVIWLFTEYYGKRYNVDANLTFGAKVNTLIMSGEYWRLITPIFLHGGLMHIAFNSYSLYNLGPTVEKVFGRLKYLFIYLASGILGNVASFIFSPNPSVGASGAIFGLFGALIYMGQKRKILFTGSFGSGILITLVFNLGYGFSNSGIDNFAHIGGLVGGYLFSSALGLMGDRKITSQKIALFVLSIALIFGGTATGFQTPSNRQELTTVKAADLIKQAAAKYDAKDYVSAAELAKKVLEIKDVNDQIKGIALDLASTCLFNQGKYEEALEYSKQLLTLEPARSHYISGLCYANLQDKKNAIAELKQAVKMDPKNTHAKEVLEQLTK